MAGVDNNVNHEIMQKLFQEMSWQLRSGHAFVLNHRTTNDARENPGDDLVQNGDFRLNGLYYLCANCGYLSSDRNDDCTACNSSDWLDLRDVTVSRSLKYIAAQHRQAVSWTTRLLSGAFHLGIFIALTLGLTSSFPAGYDWSNIHWKYPLAGWFWVAVPVGLLASYYFTLRRVDNLVRRLTDARPMRWHIPTDSHFSGDFESLPHRQVSGRCEGEATLIAPFSEKQCIGYRVSVLSAEHDNTSPPQWLLEKSRNVPCTLDGSPIGRDRLAFQTTGVQIEFGSEANQGKQEKLTTFLNEHGLFPEDGNFWIFESIITPGDTVSAIVYPEHQLGFVTQIENTGHLGA